MIRSFVRLRGPVTVGAVWLAYALALAASFQHVRRAFAALEPGGDTLTGYAAAAAVEVGLAALALALVARRRTGAADGRLWSGLAAMAAVSALANADAALTALGGGARPLWRSGLDVDPLDVLRAIIGAGALPALVLYLAAAAETLTGAAIAADGAEASAAAHADRARLDDAERAPARRPARARRPSDAASADGRIAAPMRASTAATVNRVLDAAHAAPSATRAELADAAGVTLDTARRALERAGALGLIARDGGGLWTTDGRRVAARVGRGPFRTAAEASAGEGA
jgi:hypothetical protein